MVDSKREPAYFRCKCQANGKELNLNGFGVICIGDISPLAKCHQ